MEVTQVPQGWIGLSEAADLLGISVDAMRRRVRRGEYQRRQVRTRHGPAWQVRLDGSATVEPTVTPTDEPWVSPTVEHVATVDATVNAGVSELVVYLRERDQARDQELERVQADVVAKAEAAAMWQTRAEFLALQVQQRDRELADVREELRALQAPTPKPESTVSASSVAGPSDGLAGETPEPLKLKRGWWRFWA